MRVLQRKAMQCTAMLFFVIVLGRRWSCSGGADAHSRAGHAHAGRGRCLFSEEHRRWDAGRQPRPGSPLPPAPPTERERQCGGCKASSSVAPLTAARRSQTCNHTSTCGTADRSAHPLSAKNKSHGVAGRRSHTSGGSSAGFRPRRTSPVIGSSG